MVLEVMVLLVVFSFAFYKNEVCFINTFLK